MLQNLHIKNLALIREVDIDFTEGLNILTGETGAGKSIIIDSIGLALGERLARDMTKKKGRSGVELSFFVQDEPTITALQKFDVTPDDGQILISRKIVDGRSTFRVNGETRTASDVREIGGLLLDIHGQSEHQKLLKPEMQLELLDEYGKEDIRKAKEKVSEAYRVWTALRKKLGGEPMSEEERARRASFLEFEINEIDEADLKPGEDEEVERTYKKLANGRKIAEAVEEAHRVCGYDDPNGAGEMIGHALKKLDQVSEYDEALGELVHQLSDVDGLLNDFNRSLSDYADDLSFEDSTFEETEDRLNEINRLKAKYGTSIDQILAYRDEKQAELDQLKDYEENRARLQKQVDEAEQKLQSASDDLTRLRHQAAAGFGRDLVGHLLDLNFASIDFAVSIRETGRFSPNGQDAVTYMISTNPGESRKPLGKVVSGGELSRIMLGIRTMFADSDTIGTLIFDEIDTGISGRTAQKVAEKLARVSRSHQVMCITHLPQIAAMADTHFGIIKELSDTSAVTEVTRLDEEQSVDELARMIGGAEITENTRNSAREMKEMCRQYKQNEL